MQQHGLQTDLLTFCLAQLLLQTAVSLVHSPLFSVQSRGSTITGAYKSFSRRSAHRAGDEMRLSAVVLFFAASVALARGLAVRSLLFSSESSTNYVTLEPQKPLDLSSFTLCLRVATELKQQQREIILFAYRTQYYDELNLWRELDGTIGMYLSGDGVFFPVPALGPMQTHLCITWDSSTGATSVFFDGKKSLTKTYQKRHRVRSGGKVIIGQDPDEYLGNFDANQSFVGEISDINLWSRVLPSRVIKEMATSGQTGQNGDVIDWSVASLQVTGQVGIIHEDV